MFKMAILFNDERSPSKNLKYEEVLELSSNKNDKFINSTNTNIANKKPKTLQNVFKKSLIFLFLFLH